MTTYILSFYCVTHAYGGAEEGGWYYNEGRIIRTIKTFKDENKAMEFCRRANCLLEKANRAERRYNPCAAQIYCQIHEDTAPKHYPEERPYYC